MADALLEYRGKVVRLKPGHSAVEITEIMK
jgi:hypothetical protein